jgi:hypothetical protein
MATLDSIADEIGYSRNELMQSMVKFGLTNRDWRNEGLTAHKRLPRYQENPGMATKPPSPAQLAARARFAEMARSGSLNRKRQIAAKRKSNPAAEKIPGTRAVGQRAANAEIHGIGIIQDISGLSKAEAAKVLAVFIKEKAAKFNIGVGVTDFKHGAFLEKDVMLRALDAYNTDPKYTRKRNPAKKTVSEKISQLVHEGYPQKQAVAIALNEERAGKVKRNPGLYDNINAKRARIAAGSGERMRRPGTKGAPTQEAFVRSAKTARKRNPASGLVPGFAVVCMHPNPHTVAITTSMAEAKKIGQDYATRENVQVAIKPVDVHAAHFA